MEKVQGDSKPGNGDVQSPSKPVKEVGSPKPVKKVAPSQQMVTIVFKQNRHFDLHVGREMVEFRGRESKQIPKEWLEHRDFKQAAKYFTIKGVS